MSRRNFYGLRVGHFTLALALGFTAGCGGGPKGASLEKSAEEPLPPIPDVPVPKEDGPRLGAVGNATPVFDRPSRRGAALGMLHAGATVARSPEPVSTRDCAGGWYAISPAGFVCADSGATTDLRHPTLAAMAIQPKREGELPYTYARAVRDTKLFAVDASRERAVKVTADLRAKSGMAIVGSWSAIDDTGKSADLAMTTDGRFVRTADIESLKPSPFRGTDLGESRQLPIAFVVKKGVSTWSVNGVDAQKKEALAYHAEIDLTGKTRKLGRTEFWATSEGKFVRLEDVTVVRERHEFPEFAADGRRWLDVSVVTGTLVAYEGRKALFATLVSVGKDRLGNEAATAVTRRGEFPVTGKALTVLGRDAASFTEGAATYDVPWALELSSGQLLLGAYWHDRFGIERSLGNVELSPADAARVFAFAAPELPRGWHAVTSSAGAPAESRVIVNVRK